MRERRILLAIIIFQFVPMLLYPPKMLQAGLGIIGVVLLFFALLGYGLWRGQVWAYSMSIFLQGLNIIVRIMMIFQAAYNRQTGWDLQNIVFYFIAMLISGWIMLRLDKPDLRSLIAE